MNNWAVYLRGMSHSIFPLVTRARPLAADVDGRVKARAVQRRKGPKMEETTNEMMSEMTYEANDDLMVSQDEGTQAEIATIREAYSEKINAAIGADDDKLAIELSRQFRDEAFEAIFGENARKRDVA